MIIENIFNGDEENDIFKITHKFTAQFADEISLDISKEQEKILSKITHPSKQFYDDSICYDIILAQDDSYLGLIRHGFNIMDNKVMDYLEGTRYSHQILSGIRIGIAITLLELVKDENN